MNHIKLEWGNTLKYLGCLFQVNLCRVDIRQQVRKYHGNFNIMPVETKSLWYIFIKCYCVHVPTYATRVKFDSRVS